MTMTRLFVLAAVAVIATGVLLTVTPNALAGSHPSSGNGATHGPLPHGPNAVDNPGGNAPITKGNPGGHGLPPGSGSGGRPGSGGGGGRPGS
jgi:hypothetical protein